MSRGEVEGLLGMISGGGRTLLNIADRIDDGTLRARIVGVIASRECAGAERLAARGLTVRILKGDLPAKVVEDVARELGARWIVLAGYLRLVNIPASYAGRVVNIHPALLPAFGGPGMYGERVHRAVLAAGCKVSGCTVHLCDERYDHGPIVAQRCCPVLEGDTEQTLGDRVFELEKALYPEALAALLAGGAGAGPAGRE